MKKIKFSRVFAVLLALVIVVGTVPLTSLPVAAETTSDGLKYEITDGKVTITGYTGYPTEIVIPAEIEGYPVTAIKNRAFYTCKTLESIVIPDSVTTMGNYMFYSCSNLASVVLPSGITKIEASSFQKCTSLTSIVIPDGVTTIGEKAFYTCTALERVEAPENLKSIEKSAFYKCPVTFYGYSNSFIETYAEENSFGFSSMGEAEYIYGLEYTIANRAVTITGYKAKSKSLKIPAEIEGDPVTSIKSEAFKDCTSIESLEIPYSVKSIGDRITVGCENLKSVVVDSQNSVYYSEDNCIITKADKKLILACKSSEIPENIKSIGNYAFYGRTDLTTVIIPKGVTSIGNYAFYECSNLTSIVIPKDVTSIGDYAFYSCKSLVGVALPKTMKSIGKYAFAYCEAFTSLSIPDGLTEIKDYTFCSCKNITDLTIPDGVTTIWKGALSGCTSLKTITIPESVGDIGDYNFDWTSIETIYYAGTERQWKQIYIGFGGNNAIRQAEIIYIGDLNAPVIPIPDGLEYKIQHDEAMITGYRGNAKELDIPALIDKAPVTSIGNHAFHYCDTLESVTVPGEVRDIGESAFYECTSLKNVDLPESVVFINGGAFNGCVSLTSMTLPDRVISIGIMAFYNCAKLESITLPASLSYISDGAFRDCTSLKTVYYGGTKAQWNSMTIEANNECLTNAEIIFLGEEEPELIIGDVNLDGIVNSIDSNLLKRIISGNYAIESGTSEYLASDINGDGQINSVDSNLLKRLIAGSN